VAIDPGHGGPVQTGAVSAQGLAEKTVNLRIALRLAALLRAGGFKAVLTRTSDSPVNARGLDLNADGRLTNDDDLQARVDIANAAHADILVSIHNNGALDRTVGGTRTYYEDTRPFSALSRRLAGDIQRNMVASIQAAGYPTKDWGALTDEPLKKPYGHLFLLGPANPRVARPSRMPGALGETLYLSNPREAALLATPEMQQAIALGYYRGIVAYFQDGAASLGTGH
jgi:N-acetylmuramoyl-L-alanine amidase